MVELVVSIVIISISVTGVMMVITQLAGSSADPMIRTQATAIAQAYLEEILAQPLSDPDGGETGAAETGEARATFDDVQDYNGLNDTTGAVDQFANPINGLGAYNIAISVTDSTLGGRAAKRILVTISHDAVNDFSLPVETYRLN